MHIRQPIIYELASMRESELKSELVGLRTDYKKQQDYMRDLQRDFER